MNNVIIVAGGKGLRMGQDLPKQFIPIGDKPILMHTIEAFFKFDNSIRIVVALSESYLDYWSTICEEYGFNIKHEVVVGGETRFHSVKNALDIINEGFVAVHDAARPFVSSQLIDSCFKASVIYHSVIPVLEVTDSLRELIDKEESKIVNRNAFRTVQTPQVFEVNLLKRAYEIDFRTTFTDDASVIEALGEHIHLIEGERNNIKITTPFDLDLSKVLVEKNDANGYLY